MAEFFDKDIHDAYATAIDLRETGRFDEAEVWLSGHLVRHPTDGVAFALLTHVHLLQDDVEKAAATLAQAERLAPQELLVLQNLARVALRTNRIEEAALAITRALPSAPANPESRLILAAVHAAQGNGNASRAMLDTILAERPDIAEAWASRALSRLRMNDFDGATADAGQAVALKSHLTNAWKLLATLHLQANRVDAAVEALERYCALAPKDVASKVDLGEFLRRVGRVEDAVLLLEAAVGQRPDLIAGWVNLGAALQQVGRVDDAKVAHRKARSMKPDQLEVAINLYKAHDFEEALEVFERVGQNSPNELTFTALASWFQLAQFYRNQGMMEFFDRWAMKIPCTPQQLSLLSTFPLTQEWIGGRHDRAWQIVEKYYPAVKDEKDRNSQTARSFLIFVGRMIVNARANSIVYSNNSDVIVNCIGESHCLPVALAVFPWNGQLVCGLSHLIMGVKMHHLGSQQPNVHQTLFRAKLKQIPRQSELLVTIGEIDCRPDEGIWPYHRKSGRALGEVIETTVRNYLGFLDGALTDHDPATITVQGIPNPGYDCAPLLKDEERPEDFLAIFPLVNELLRKDVLRRGWGFLDVYKATLSPQGGEWRIDGRHLSPNFYLQAERWLEFAVARPDSPVPPPASGGQDQ